MTKKNIQCSLAGLGRTMALRALDVAGSGTARGAQHCGHGDDDVVVGSRTAS
jgi:hypothetical protein